MSSPTPFERTLAILGSSRNKAAAETLACVLHSTDSHCRDLAFKVLVERSDQAACQAIVRRFHHLSEQEIESLAPIQPALIDAIGELSTSKNSETRKGWISATMALRATGHFHSVVVIAENHRDPLSGFAEDQILDLASQLGETARFARDIPSVRQPLLQVLYDSIERYSDHRNLLLLDAFLCGSNTNDSLLKSIFADDGHKFKKLILRQMRLSQRESILQLLAEFFFRNDCPRSVAKIVNLRNGQPLGIALAKIASNGLTNGIRQQLARNDPPNCLLSITTDDPNINLESRCAALLLTSYTTAPPSRILSGVATLIQRKEECAQKTAVEILKSYDFLKPIEIASELAKSSSATASLPSSSSEATSIHSSLNCILHHFSQSNLLIRNAIKRFFSEFTIDNMLQISDSWSPNQLTSYAEIVSVVVSDWDEQLMEQLTSISPMRRLRSSKILQYFSLTDDLWEQCKRLCFEPNIQVRLQTIDIVAESNRPDSRDVLLKLTQDINTDVHNKSTELLTRFDIRTGYVKVSAEKTMASK